MENNNMKPKTVAESIAELRDQLASIESTSANIHLTETAQPSNSLQEHMQQVEQDYLFEKSLAGDIINKGSNFVRGWQGKKNPKGVMKKDPKVPGQPRTSTEQPATPGDITAHKIGKGVKTGVNTAVGAAGVGGVASLDHKLTTGNWLPDWMHGDEKPEGTTDGKITGGDAKPHTEPNYDEKTAHLQQWLLDQGADLGTTGPNGNGVDGVMGEKTRQAAKDLHIAGYEDSAAPPVAPVPPTRQTPPPAAPVTPSVPPAAPVTPNAPPAENSNAEFQTIVDKFEKTFKELEGLTKGDPAAQSELENIKRNAGY